MALRLRTIVRTGLRPLYLLVYSGGLALLANPYSIVSRRLFVCAPPQEDWRRMWVAPKRQLHVLGLRAEWLLRHEKFEGSVYIFPLYLGLGALDPSELTIERDDNLCRSYCSETHGQCGAPRNFKKYSCHFKYRSCPQTRGRYEMSTSNTPARWRNLTSGHRDSFFHCSLAKLNCTWRLQEMLAILWYTGGMTHLNSDVAALLTL